MNLAAPDPRAKADPFDLRGTVHRSLIGVFVVFIAARSALLWWQYDALLLGKPYRRRDLATKVREVQDEPAAA